MNTNITIHGRSLYVTPRGLKLGTKGRVENPSKLLSQLDKGQARKIRKALRRMGETQKAAAPRISQLV